MNYQDLIRVIRNEVRSTVDPMFLKDRVDLYGSPYSGQIKTSLIPTQVIAGAVADGIQDAANGAAFIPVFTQYAAGPSGIAAGKAVVYNGSHLELADSTNISHFGRVVGVTTDSAGAGDQARVQTYGVLERDFLSLASTVGYVFVGTSGSLAAVPFGSSAFIKVIGISLAANKLLLVHDSFSIGV